VGEVLVGKTTEAFFDSLVDVFVTYEFDLRIPAAQDEAHSSVACAKIHDLLSGPKIQEVENRADLVVRGEEALDGEPDPELLVPLAVLLVVLFVVLFVVLPTDSSFDALRIETKLLVGIGRKWRRRPTDPVQAFTLPKSDLRLGAKLSHWLS
jgi:hypothetical protein